ncbi:hypothetical protein CBP31_02670 [Oceanisphaera profunda]|uniref:Uncharacterized protein n=1 Tax=Oceanisphaera profunda TaxID=1416627 RepID=A0A1Y0D2C1_9GAMM|nr:hypothetical protein [Oceanisphaera profunda]ART81668.1 hypothetical protein CBP31_02670 [Oceanisphaera profunda]
MAKITQVQLQGIHYYWDGKDILVDDGVGDPWSISGSLLERIELEQIALVDDEYEQETTALFSFDFLAQQWSLVNASLTEDIKLFDEHGQECAWRLLTAVAEHPDAGLLAQILIPTVPANALQTEALQAESELAPLLSAEPESVTRAVTISVEDILQDAESLLVPLNVSALDTLSLNTAAVDDVLNWLAVYSHPDL